jgi:tetratricopeptide (TPR) repeat protein
MKSERRHELQTNLLADWLGDMIEKSRPYQTSILGVFLLAVLAIAGGLYWSSHSRAQAAEAWQKLASINTQSLDEVGDQYKNTPIGNMAAVVAGDVYLLNATQERFSSRATANQKLTAAIDKYELVLKTPADPMLLERASYGIARAYETQGKLDEAVNAYQNVVKEWPNGTYADAAARRLADLQRPETKEFYDEFARFDPKPAYANEPGMPSKSSLSKPDSLAEPGEGPVFKHEPLLNLGDDKDKGAKDKAEDKPVKEKSTKDKAEATPPAPSTPPVAPAKTSDTKANSAK